MKILYNWMEKQSSVIYPIKHRSHYIQWYIQSNIDLIIFNDISNQTSISLYSMIYPIKYRSHYIQWESNVISNTQESSQVKILLIIITQNSTIYTHKQNKICNVTKNGMDLYIYHTAVKKNELLNVLFLIIL